MKTYFVLIAAISFVLFSCKKDQDINQRLILGEWNLRQSTDTAGILREYADTLKAEFFEDGLCTVTIHYGPPLGIQEFTNRYSISHSLLTIDTPSVWSLSLSPSPYFNVLSLTDSVFHIETSDQEHELVFRR